MFTFLWLIVAFMAVVMLLDLLVLRTRVVLDGRTYRRMVPLLLLTAIFDNILISLPAYVFNRPRTLGIYVYRMPIEDFAYMAMVVLLVGMLTQYAKHKNHA